MINFTNEYNLIWKCCLFIWFHMSNIWNTYNSWPIISDITIRQTGFRVISVRIPAPPSRRRCSSASPFNCFRSAFWKIFFFWFSLNFPSPRNNLKLLSSLQMMFSPSEYSQLPCFLQTLTFSDIICIFQRFLDCYSATISYISHNLLLTVLVETVLPLSVSLSLQVIFGENSTYYFWK